MEVDLANIISFFVLLLAVASNWITLARSGRGGQLVIDKEQNMKIEELQRYCDRHDERINGVIDRIQWVATIQANHEERTEKSLKEIAVKVENMPQKIVDLLNSTKK